MMHFDHENRLATILALDFEAVPQGNIYAVGAVFGERVFHEQDIHD